MLFLNHHEGVPDFALEIEVLLLDADLQLGLDIRVFQVLDELNRAVEYLREGVAILIASFQHVFYQGRLLLQLPL